MQKSFDATRNEPSLHLRRARCHGHGFSPLRFAALREASYGPDSADLCRAQSRRLFGVLGAHRGMWQAPTGWNRHWRATVDEDGQYSFAIAL